MNRHVFRLLLLGLIAAVVLGAVGFGQTGNHPRLALQYWRAGDSPDWPVLRDEPVWVDGHEENSGQGHWEDFNGDGEEDGWVSEAYWVDGTWQSVWVEGDPLPDGVFGSSWATDAGTFNINSASSTWSSAGTWHSGGYTRGNLLFPFEYYDIITFRAWGLAPANNCNFYSYGVYRPDGSLETGNSGVGWSFPGGSAVMDGSFFASQNGVWRIDVRYHNATGVSPEAGTVSYYLTVGPALTQTITFDPIPTHAFGDAPFALHATAASGLPVALSVVSGPATLSGDVITLTGNGAVTVRAAQAGGMVSGTFWNAAPPVDRTFSVIGIAQTISFAALPARTQADPPFALTATASSGLPVTFSVTAGPAIISGNVVSLTGAGTVVITAVQNGGGVFGSTLTVSRSFTVSPVPPPEITSASAVEARVGTQFDYAFTFTQPVSAMIWDAGYLPAGLEWSGPLGGMYGRISGTPTVSGIFSLVFRPWGAVGVGPSFTLVIDVKTSSGLSVPTIITQPQNRIAAAGAYVFLNVHASSASSYLWYKDGAALTYQISPFMVVFAAGAVDVGTYAVVVRNSAGSVTSAPATLSVEGLPPPPPPVVGALPVIITQPQDLTVPAGQAASYTVAAASATPLAYQWLRNGVLIAGATANSFSILQTSYASNGHFYSVVVSNSAGSVTSAAAELLVTGPVLTVSHLLPNSFRLTWTTETSGGNDVSYRVLIRDFIDTANATQPFDVVGLAPATTYAVEVQAIDYAGTVFRSVPLRITTPAASGVAPVAAKNTARSVQRAAFATSQPVVRTLTTVASPPAPLPSQWLDVWVGQKHGKTWIKTTDGIMDEVMDLNDPGRNALISITGVTLTYSYSVLGSAVLSPFALHWELDTAAFFGTSSFTDISDADGNYDGPVGLNEMAVAYFVHVETNYTGDAEFELEAGYDYGVYSMTSGNDANDPSKWGFEGSPTQIAGTTRGRLTMSDIQPITKKWYRLVRYGKAPTLPNWTPEGIAADPDPIRYYMADRARFLSVMDVDWNWDAAVSRGEWGDWTFPNPELFFSAVASATAGADGIPDVIPPPGMSATEWIRILQQAGRLAGAAGRRVLAALVMVNLIKQIPTAHAFYEKTHRDYPSKIYSGRSFGIGLPTQIMISRNKNHHRNGNHGGPVLKAYIMLKGVHSYADKAAFGREQQMIDFNGGFKPNDGYLLNLTNSTNQRREVAADNIVGPMLWLTATDAFGGWLAPYSGDTPELWQQWVWPRQGMYGFIEGTIIKIAPPAQLSPE